MINNHDWRHDAVLSIEEVAFYAGVPRPTVFHWFSLAQAMGRTCGIKEGRNRYFDFDDLYLAALLGCIHRRGIQVTDKAIRSAIAFTADLNEDEPARDTVWRVFNNPDEADIVVPALIPYWRSRDFVRTRPYAS